MGSEQHTIFVPRARSEEDLLAEVDRLDVIRELLARGLVQLDPERLTAETVRQLHMSRAPAVEVQRNEALRGVPQSIAARLFGGEVKLRRWRAAPYEGKAERVEDAGLTHEVRPPLWTLPWVEPLLDLRASKVLSGGALTWSLRRGLADRDWGPALLAVAALAEDGGTIDPTVAFVRLPMEADGYCFFCGSRRGDHSALKVEHDLRCVPRSTYARDNAYGVAP